MNFYIDVLINPNAEMRINVLLNTVYTKLHKAIFDLRAKNIGVSFPNHNITLGNILRIHGDEKTLRVLQDQNWIGGMSGYCNISGIQPVPDSAKFCTVSRKQTTMSQSKLRRLLKRGSISEDEIQQYKAKMFARGLDNPYLELVSSSTGQKHRRYIEFGELKGEATHGQFDCFGLSKSATVPWF
ncbi:type I-F CRISPR-associated endoribonuclease Cas6/Csy4 [Methylophaga nitratireducenticrescens]|uniref:CRISPR-associated protein Cas6/Csy4, subtype I-F/YPEST n=1 Tax=Methylophaga nitratireducenticrescens TaxID=754476 RepID=I1XLY0_METNJ|nr:type I-F CRISPR-associated endoribonuclease Cas6/Csy4 [Methylophaga nitratireducenticrescens]AFI85399.1 type I-F CRISPR-associated endoribonuclease Cas6/Csy4 [Methylophaga nitratireducenticrescens]AUZ85159.1 type I-F CRISPR-associated endoribonuclease Cas6/Csy4 [Methylophaga nitratireducenticrescens]